MSGIEHYREAERLLREVGERTWGDQNRGKIDAAQAHATLALTAVLGGGGDE